MQTLVASVKCSDRAIDTLKFHCAVQFIRNLINANPLTANSISSGKYANRTKIEYPDVVRHFSKGQSGSVQEIIEKATEKAIAYIAEKERRQIVQVHNHFQAEAEKVYSNLSGQYSPDILEKQISYIEYLVLKPVSERCGG